MNQYFGLPIIAIGAMSVINVCLLVTAAFYPERTASYVVVPMLRVKLGYVAVSLGLCSQVLYCLMTLSAILKRVFPGRVHYYPQRHYWLLCSAGDCGDGRAFGLRPRLTCFGR